MVIDMYHIQEKTTAQFEMKKSQFICLLFPINDDKKIKEIIKEVKKDYPKATHYCYGSIINNTQRSNDDGEPASTAGKPIAETLKNHQLDNVLAVVVRYFGGTLLGTAGLVKAYSTACQSAIEKAVLTQPLSLKEYQLTVDYSLTNKIEFILRNNAYNFTRYFNEEAKYIYTCKKDINNLITEATSGQYQPQYIKDVIIEEKI